MSFTLPKLPFDMKSLSPYVSEEQLQFHYGKHHAAYINKLNPMIQDKPEAEWTLRKIITNSTGGMFNNSAQAWNHTFFWNCLSPNGGKKPVGALMQAIERDFGSFESFKEKFSDSALTLFGSGWAWLAKDTSGKLEIMPLSNADTPLKHGKEPVLTLDVWEHAYYIDYRNERPRFIQGFWDVANWDFAASAYAGTAKAEGL